MVDYDHERWQLKNDYESGEQTIHRMTTSDVTIVFANKQLRVSREVLSKASRVFERMFANEGFVEHNQSVVYVEEKKAEAFQVMIQWMYGESVELPVSYPDSLALLFDTMVCCDKWDVQDLLDRLVEVLLARIDNATASQLVTATLHLEKDTYPEWMETMVYQRVPYMIHGMLQYEEFIKVFISDLDFAASIFLIRADMLDPASKVRKTVLPTFRVIAAIQPGSYLVDVLKVRVSESRRRGEGWVDKRAKRMLEDKEMVKVLEGNKALCMDLILCAHAPDLELKVVRVKCACGRWFENHVPEHSCANHRCVLGQKVWIEEERNPWYSYDWIHRM